MANKNQSSSSFQEKLSEKMNGYFVNVIKDKNKYYSDNPNKKPHRNEAKLIISKYSNLNATISGGLSLIPGPMGLVAAVPEIAMVIKNQINMIYDIGVSLGKESKLKPELLMYVFATALGSTTGSLAIMHGSKLVIKRTSLSVMQKIIKALAGNITQKLLRTMLAKWVPIAGAIIMATWSKVSTTMVGKKAIEIFDNEIEFVDEDVDYFKNSNINEDFNFIANDFNEVDFHKTLLYIALIHSDNKIDREEYKYIIPLIKNENFNTEQQQKLMDVLNKKTHNSFDLNLISKNANEVIATIWELISLAQRDGNFHPSEKMFIKKLIKDMGFLDTDIEDLLIVIDSDIDKSKSILNEFDTVNLNFNEIENKYAEFLNDVIENGVINDTARSLIERKRINLSITDQRAKEIENHLLGKDKFTEEELKLIDDIEFVLENDGFIDNEEQMFLDKKIQKYKISKTRANELVELLRSRK